MKILFFFIVTNMAMAYDSSRIQADLKLIKKQLLPQKQVQKTQANTAKPIRQREITKQEEIKDLETLYFDEIKTKAAAPRRRRQR